MTEPLFQTGDMVTSKFTNNIYIIEDYVKYHTGVESHVYSAVCIFPKDKFLHEFPAILEANVWVIKNSIIDFINGTIK